MGGEKEEGTVKPAEMASYLWVQWHARRGHEILDADGKDRLVFTCSCGATYLIAK